MQISEETKTLVQTALIAISQILLVFKHVNPFENTGHKYKGKCFEVEAYSWDDDDQKYNFKWRDIEVSWYKYLCRGMEVNREVSEDEIKNMLLEIIKEIIVIE